MALATKPAVAVALCSALWGLSSCQRLNPQYCEGAEHNRCPADGGTTDGSGAPRCTSNSECSSPQAAVCDLGDTGTCVQCTVTSASACVGPAPVCADRMCRACIAHTECPASNVCLPDGACANAADVAYVRGNGSGLACTQGEPCRTLEDGLRTRRPVVKLQGTISDLKVIFVDNPVAILGDPGSRLELGGGRLEIREDAVTIVDLEITGVASDSALLFLSGDAPALALTRVTLRSTEGDGIVIIDGNVTITESTITGNPGTGISALDGTLTVTRSVISDNEEAGIAIGPGVSAFAIVGNVIVGNGLPQFPGGGLLIDEVPANSRLEFNTFFMNLSVSGSGAAIRCNGPLIARNNIMSGNGEPAHTQQVSGSCTHTYSIVHSVQPGMLPPGEGNKAMDPQFVNAAAGDFHLQPTSPAKGGADPRSDLSGPAARDIDGELRTLPTDIGADQARR